jgi:hypothetical protein
LAVGLGAYALTAAVVYSLLFVALRQHPPLGRPSLIFWAALALILAEPITLRVIHDSGTPIYDLGYIWPTTFHNPTLPLTKPFSLISFVCTCWCLANRGPSGGWMYAVFGVATAAAVLSKPSLIICILPAAAILMLLRLTQRKPLALRGLATGLFLPALVLLGWQYYWTYAGNSTGAQYRDSIIWAPFLVVGHYSSHIALKLLLSTAFPLAVMVAYWKRTHRDIPLMLAWMSFLFAAFYAYALAEKLRTFEANFLWSADLAVFVLFVVSATFWLSELAASPTNRGRNVLCGSILLLHAISGGVWTWTYARAF